jgi:hypothetical protein
MGKVKAHPFGADLFWEGQYLKVVNGRVFRWSDVSGWVRSTKDRQHVLDQIESRRARKVDCLRVEVGI